MTLVLIGTDLVLEASTTKIEDKQVPGIYIYLHFLVYIKYICVLSPIPPADRFPVIVTWTCLVGDSQIYLHLPPLV